MLAHGAPRLGGILVGNAADDARMLVLDAFEISPPLGRRVNRKPHALAGAVDGAPGGANGGDLATVPAFSLALPNLFLGKF